MDQKMKDKKYMADILQGAENGQVSKMELAGDHYKNGKHGFNQDSALAYQWFDKARKAGSVIGLGNVGDMLTTENGVAKNTTLGIMYLTRAALEKGSPYASFKLGIALAKGKFGLPVDRKDAIHWLKKARGKGTRDFLDDDEKAHAGKVLEESLTLLV